VADPKLPFAPISGERVVLVQPAASVRGFGLLSGQLWLTDRRLYFQPRVPWYYWIAPFVGVGIWLIGKAHRRDLALADVERHARLPFGKNPNMLRLGTRGAGDHNYIVEDYAPFAAALAQQPAFVSREVTV
jgi:hypothetical protein